MSLLCIYIFPEPQLPCDKPKLCTGYIDNGTTTKSAITRKQYFIMIFQYYSQGLSCLHFCYKFYKMLSYRRETALQGAL